MKNKDKYNGIFEVLKGKYFFLGDNRLDLVDLRYWKDLYVDVFDIKGKF